jgi:YHS domain-containing protein
MKQNNQLKCYALAGVAALWLAGNVLADDTAKPPCCAGMTTPMQADVSTNAVPDLLKTCPVSGEKLGEMGKPLTFTYKDQEVKLCCKSCKKDFDKDPAKYLKLIRAADKK